MTQSNSTLARLPYAKALGSTLLLGTMALGTACNSTPFQAPKPQPEGQADKFYEVNPIRDVDLVFMVDNSGSMKEEQDKLRKNFPALIETLRKIPGGLPNLHIGIISSDVGAGNITISGNPACNTPGGDRGRFRVKAGCGLDPAVANFLVTENNDTVKNYMGKLEDVFACLAELGDRGCGFEHQFQSIRVALGATPENAGFLRENAFLAVVLITDEDDCSGEPSSDLYADQSFEGQQGSLRCNITGHLCDGAPPPANEFQTTLEKCVANPGGRLIPIPQFTRFLLDLKPNFPQRVIVSAITGLPDKETGTPYQFRKSTRGGTGELLDIEPVCTGGPMETAAPSLRVSEFVKSFGANGTLDSICKDDFSPALKRIGELIAARLDPGCINEKLIDADSKTAGLQAECAVLDRVPNQGGTFDDKVLPECGKGATPCWKMQAPGAAENTCAAGAYRVFVDRAGKEAPKGTVQSVKCRACANGDDPRCKT